MVNIGLNTFARIVTSALAAASEPVQVKATFVTSDDWLVACVVGGERHVAYVCGCCGVEVSLAGVAVAVSSFENEEYLGRWLVGEAL